MLNKLLSVSEEEEPTTDKRTEKVRGGGRPRKIVEENVESTPKNKGPGGGRGRGARAKSALSHQ